MRTTICLVLVMAATADGALTLRADRESVPKFGRVEFALQTDARFANPYDPAEIDLSVELIAPSGKKVTTPAFFTQPYEAKAIERGNRKLTWLYPSGGAGFRARFAPIETGQYSAVALLRQNKVETRSAAVSFTVTASTGRGFVRVSPRDPRYFEFDDGSPYFAIGQNVAFIKDLFHNGEMVRRLGAAGGNYARVWCCCEDWGMAIESQKSAWGRSWDKRNPFSKLDGDSSGRLYVKLTGDAGASIACNPADPVSLRPGTRYRLSGKVLLSDGSGVSIQFGTPITISGKPDTWQSFESEFTAAPNQYVLQPFSLRLTSRGAVYIDALALHEVPGGNRQADTGNLLLHADPNAPPLGIYHQRDAAVLDHLVEVAEQSGVYLQLTTLTRNLYMNQLSKAGSDEYARATRLAKNVLRYFVARWGYSTHVISWEYFNEMDPGKPTEKFYTELAEHFDSIDPNRHLRATSDWHFPTRVFAHPRLDQADTHFYLRPPSGEIWKDAVASVQKQFAAGHAKLGSPRPYLLSEFGITDDKWQMNPAVKQDKQWLHWHDANWTAMLGGFASTGCHWYWDEIHSRDAYSSIYPPLVKFAADIPWTTAGFKPARATIDRDLRVLGLAGNDLACLFVSDPRATWHAAVMEGQQPRRIDGAAIRIEGLLAGKYQVEWWDTRRGEIVTRQAIDSTGTATITSPPFERAIACKLKRAR